LPDEEILALYFQRDEAAITETEKKYGGYCRKIAAGCLPQAEDREECISDTYLQVWNAIPPQRPDNLRLYLGAIVRNLAFSLWRKLYTHKRGGAAVELALDELAECLCAPGTPEEAVEARELGGRLDRFLEGLPARDRQIFVRRYYFTETAAEIAPRFDLRENTVLAVLSRTRKKLRVYLQKEGYTV
jgi:RNA polymerase sigma-70 factor (ECF subfamily)